MQCVGLELQVWSAATAGDVSPSAESYSGQLVDRGGQPVDRGGQPEDRGGQPVDRGGQLVDRGGQPVDRSGQPVDHGGQPVDCGGQPEDMYIGCVHVDLRTLALGLPQITGWYNISDFCGEIQGQLKV